LCGNRLQPNNARRVVLEGRRQCHRKLPVSSLTLTRLALLVLPLTATLLLGGFLLMLRRGLLLTLCRRLLLMLRRGLLLTLCRGLLLMLCRGLLLTLRRGLLLMLCRGLLLMLCRGLLMLRRALPWRLHLIPVYQASLLNRGLGWGYPLNLFAASLLWLRARGKLGFLPGWRRRRGTLGVR